MKTVSGMNLKDVLITIKNGTQPIEGHDDPNAIEDCWNEVFETIEAQDILIRNLINALRIAFQCALDGEMETADKELIKLVLEKVKEIE